MLWCLPKCPTSFFFLQYYDVNFANMLSHLECIKSPCPPSHLGTWLCEGGGHGSESAVSAKLV